MVSTSVFFFLLRRAASPVIGLATIPFFLYHGYEVEAFQPKSPAIPAGCEILTSLLAFG